MKTAEPPNDTNLKIDVPKWRDISSRGRCLECWDLCVDLLEHRWPQMRGRSVRFDAACEVLGRAMNFNDQKRFALRLAARYRAIGMLAFDDTALNKAKAIQAHHEFARTYTSLSAKLVNKSFPDFPDAVEGIWFQHERPDRTGPHGLGTGEIPEIAGIIAVVNTIELIGQDADKSGPDLRSRIVAAVTRGAGTQFDEPVCRAFKRTATKVFEVMGLGGATQSESPTAGAAERPTKPSPQRPRPTETKRSTPAPPKHVESERQEAVGTTPLDCGRTVPSEHTAVAPLSLEDLRPLIDRAELSAAIEKITRLRPFSTAVQNVMQVAGNEDSSIDDVGDALMRDQALSIRILKLANSSAYSRGRPVSTVKDAVMRIGVREMRSIIMTFDVFEHFCEAVSTHLDARLFSEHSMATGLFGVALAQECGVPKPDDYMLWGMLHDVGRLILIENLPGQYAAVLNAAEQLKLPLHIVETKLLHCDHCDVLREALEHWGFPEDFAMPIVNHHRSLEDVKDLPPEQARATATITLANRLSHALALGQSGNDMVKPVDKLIKFLGIDSSKIVELATLVCKETQSLKYTLLSRTNSANWSDAIDVLRKRTNEAVIPIYKSARMKVDPYRMFFERLVETESDATPTAAIHHVRTRAEHDRFLRGLEVIEQRNGAGKLPLLLIHPPGVRVEPPADRPCTVRSTPVRVTDLVDALNELVARTT